MSTPQILPFAEFAESVVPNGAVNRLPQIGSGMEVLTYSVFMNGPAAKDIPFDSQESHFQDVMLHPLTAKLGLNPEVFRDNMKVAELVAIRFAWMAAVLDSSLQRDQEGTLVVTSPEIVHDYELLTDGLNHPWIQEQIREQKALTASLVPALDAARESAGSAVNEKVPYEVSNGTILSQNNDFTVQEIGGGNVVAHENRRLSVMPAVGESVTVTYYRGKGQVFENSHDLAVTAPYVDPQTGDLAVNMVDSGKNVQQVVLFNGVASFAQFVDELGLDKVLIKEAVDARAAWPKPVMAIEKPIRSDLSDMYVDTKSGCMALDYTENAGRHTVLFGTVSALHKYAADFGVDETRLWQGESLSEEMQKEPVHTNSADMSYQLAYKNASADYLMASKANEQKGRYIGPVMAETAFHVVQDIGRQTAVIHDKRNLDKVPSLGTALTVNYADGRGTVVDPQSKNRGR